MWAGEIKVLQLQKYRAFSEPQNPLSAEKYKQMVELFGKLFTEPYPPDARCNIKKADEIIATDLNIQSLKIAFTAFLDQNSESAENVESIPVFPPLARRQETTVRDGEKYDAIIKTISLYTKIDDIQIALLN